MRPVVTGARTGRVGVEVRGLSLSWVSPTFRPVPIGKTARPFSASVTLDHGKTVLARAVTRVTRRREPRTRRFCVLSGAARNGHDTCDSSHIPPVAKNLGSTGSLVNHFWGLWP